MSIWFGERSPRQLRKNMFSGTVYSVAIAIAGFLAYPLYLKYLGPERYGLWATVVALLSFSRLGQCGLDTAVAKFVSESLGTGKRERATQYTTSAFLLLSVAGAILIFVSTAMRGVLADVAGLQGASRAEGILFISLLGFVAVLGLYSNILRAAIVGFGRADLANYAEVTARGLQVATAVVLLVGFRLGIAALYVAHVASILAPSLFWWMFLRSKCKIAVFSPRVFRIEAARELIKFGANMMTASIANMLVAPFSKVIVARYVGLPAVAFYQMAHELIRSLQSLFIKGLEATMPSISEAFNRTKGALEDAFAVRSVGARLLYLTAIPAYVALIAAAPFVLRLWLGGQYDPRIVSVLRILSVGWLCNALAIPDYYFFIGIGKVHYSVSEEWIRAGVNVVSILIGVLFFTSGINLDVLSALNSVSLISGAFFLKILFFRFSRQYRRREYAAIREKESF